VKSLVEILNKIKFRKSINRVRHSFSKGGTVDILPTSLRKCSECGEHYNFRLYHMIDQITGRYDTFENNQKEKGYCDPCGKITKAIPVDAQDLI